MGGALIVAVLGYGLTLLLVVYGTTGIIAGLVALARGTPRGRDEGSALFFIGVFLLVLAFGFAAATYVVSGI